MSKNEYLLDMDSEAFNAFKSDFRSIFNATVGEMETKRCFDAKIGVTFSINLQPGEAPDPKAVAYNGNRDILIPTIKHKISAKLQTTFSQDGVTGGEEYELVWDKDAHSYLMRKIRSAQGSLFDEMDEIDEIDQAAMDAEFSSQDDGEAQEEE